MAASGILKDGRRWTVGESGIKTLKRTYQVLLDAVTATNGEGATFPNVPAIGSEHPVIKGLFAATYDVEEGRGTSKATLNVTVNYERKTVETIGGGTPEEPTETPAQVERWGWDSGTEERELTTAVDGTPVLNSAGDVFDRVPSVSVSAPTFTKVVKFKTRQADAMHLDCKVNGKAVTIGGLTYAVGSLRASVSEERLLDDETWNYRYTISLKFRSNPVSLAASSMMTDIGWDVAVTDAGMREKDSSTGKLKLISQINAETGRQSLITSPELLNGNGQAVTREPGATAPTPFNFRFKAYERADFPSWFVSEPALVAPTDD